MPRREHRPPPRPIVRPLDGQRVGAVTRAILASFGQIQARNGWRPDPVAQAALYAGAALETDDAHGRQEGLVVQGDRLSLADLQALRAVLEPVVEALDHGGVGTWHLDCSDCAIVLAFGHLRGSLDWPVVSP